MVTDLAVASHDVEVLQSPAQLRVSQHSYGHVGEGAEGHQGDSARVSLTSSIQSHPTTPPPHPHLAHPGEHSPGSLLTDSLQVRCLVKTDVIEAVLAVVSVSVDVRDHQGLLRPAVHGDLSATRAVYMKIFITD